MRSRCLLIMGLTGREFAGEVDYVCQCLCSGCTGRKKTGLHPNGEAFRRDCQGFRAIEIFENWELEVPDGERTDYRKAVQAEPGEKIVLSWIVWPDRETGARAHKGMFEDPRINDIGEMPFDGSRMIMGGFEPVLVYREAAARD